MGTRAGREMQGGGRKTMKVEKKAKGVRNVHNLGVDVTDIQQKPVVFDKRSIQRLSPSSATPTTPQTPISPFVDALWTNLNEQQKESTLYLNEHLTQASWILLRRRGSPQDAADGRGGRPEGARDRADDAERELR